MGVVRKKVSVSTWRKTNWALQQALRAGDLVDARRQANTLLRYLTEMGLVDESSRPIHHSGASDTSPGVDDKEKGIEVKSQLTVDKQCDNVNELNRPLTIADRCQ